MAATKEKTNGKVEKGGTHNNKKKDDEKTKS
jgi:hypothetical protein